MSTDRAMEHLSIARRHKHLTGIGQQLIVSDLTDLNVTMAPPNNRSHTPALSLSKFLHRLTVPFRRSVGKEDLCRRPECLCLVAVLIEVFRREDLRG